MKIKHKRVEDMELLSCPFCGCSMGILFLGGGYQWYGNHHHSCILAQNPSGSYGRVEDMAREWNQREGNK